MQSQTIVSSQPTVITQPLSSNPQVQYISQPLTSTTTTQPTIISQPLSQPLVQPTIVSNTTRPSVMLATTSTNSLPYGWEECVDPRSGKTYYKGLSPTPCLLIWLL
jgi:hypothetical protein